MRGNQFGRLFSLITFGESHGPAMGAVVDGCPAGVLWRQELLECFLARRRPGSSAIVSGRNEPDHARVLSGVFEGKTLGTPIAMVIDNRDSRSADYKPELLNQRRGHATDLWQEKFGHSDPRGSGRASGRETVSRILGGSVARMMAEQLHPEIRVVALTESVGPVSLDLNEINMVLKELTTDPWAVDQYSSRCPSLEKNREIENLLLTAKESGNSYGGTVALRILGLPRGLGQPVFNKLKSSLADAMLGVGATTALEIGEGFPTSAQSGKEFHHDSQIYGGMRGGLSTGEPLALRVAFKPASSRGEMAKQGRHDPCIVPRAVPVLEAMAWLVLADHILQNRLDRI